MELRLQFQNAAEQLENPLYPSARAGQLCQHIGGRLAPFTPPLLSVSWHRPLPYSNIHRTQPPLPLSLNSSPRPALSLSLSPSFTHPVVSHGTGIRIVISNRATTHEPLPCRSKFVNGLRIPGLRSAARTKNPSTAEASTPNMHDTCCCPKSQLRLARLVSYFELYRYGILSRICIITLGEMLPGEAIAHESLSSYVSGWWCSCVCVCVCVPL